jgi:PilZ domain-containing protein
LEQKERRLSQRLQMKLPLTVRWISDSGVGEAEVESREVSPRGLYFSLPKDVKSGSTLEIVMTLPHELTLAGSIGVRCLCQIVRTQQEDGDSFGVAVAIVRYEYLRCDEFAAYRSALPPSKT